MSAENMKTEGQPVEPSGKSILKFLQNNRNGATISDVVRHLRAELRCPETEQLRKAVENLMENGVAIGFLHKNGVQYYAWNPVENVRQRTSTKRARGAKKRRRTDDDADHHSNRSDEDADSGRRSHRSDEDGEGTRKRRSGKDGETGRRRHADKKDAGPPPRSDEEGNSPRRTRRRRPRPAPTACYCYAWTPRRRQRYSFSSNDSSRSSSVAD